jgi:acetyl-CoA decarbonylase/synthase complex subunit gamma
MPKKVQPLDIYKFLPQTNCKKCEEANCMAFAAKVVDRTVKLEKCTPLYDAPYKKQLEQLATMLAPLVKEITIGVGERAVTIGGQEVMYRHELTFFNQTAIAIDVHDFMPEQELLNRIKQIDNFQVSRIGKTLKLDLVAVRSVSNDPDQFKGIITKIRNNTKLPMILCSYKPEVLKAGLEAAGDQHPLIYAAIKDTWKEVGGLALQYGCPVVASAPNDLATLKSIAHSLRELGVKDIVLDPGSYFGSGALADTVDNFTMLRRAAIEREDPDLAFPIIGIPASIWLKPESDPIATINNENIFAAIMIDRFADIIVLHTLDVWALLPLVTLRQAIYTDPRRPVAVKPGLREFGTVDENVPVFVTANFALTYYTVESDISSANLNCYLMVLDTEGIGVEASVAGKQWTAEKVADMIKASDLEKKVNHKKLIIPGLAARLKGDIEDATGWEVIVGPRDSGDIPRFLEQQKQKGK